MEGIERRRLAWDNNREVRLFISKLSELRESANLTIAEVARRPGTTNRAAAKELLKTKSLREVAKIFNTSTPVLHRIRHS